MKIIFFMANNFFTKKNYIDLYVEAIKKYFDVEIWCLLKLNEKKYQDYNKIIVPDKIADTIYIKSYNDLEEKIKNIPKNSIFITQYYNPFRQKEIFDLIKKYNGILIDVYKDSLNYYLDEKIKLNAENMPLKKKFFLKIITNVKIRPLIYFLKRKCHFKKVFKDYLPDYCLTIRNLGGRPAKRYHYIHHIKYDSYLESIKNHSIVNYKYAVFVDSNLPFLSDIIDSRGEKSVEPNKYFNLLNNFFDYLEKKYNLKIIIAPHPKADYDNSIFKQREIIKYKTDNLIKNSEIVITHDSTSIINAVLSKKNLVFVYYNEMLETGTKDWALRTIEYSKILKAPLVDLEKEFNLNLNINNKIFDKFVSNFIINKKKKKFSNEDIIIDLLKSLKNKNFKNFN